MKNIKWLGLLIFAVAALAVLAALIGWRLVESRRSAEVPILMYHHIGAVEDSAWCVPTDVFERQMQLLRDRGYTSILPADLAAHRRWGKTLPRRPVIITFDDGYLDSMTAAEPILRKYGLRGIVYLVTDCVGDSPEKRRQFEGADCLTWSEVQALRRRGTLAFGGHAHSHRNLAVTDDAFSSIRECYLQIKRNGGFKPDSFCYPHGEYNDRVVESVRRAGFTTAVVCEDTVAAIGPGVNLLTLPRVSMMGGQHRFTVSRAEDRESGGETVFRVRHEGIPLEVAPCLKGAPDASWLSATELGNGAEVEWRWTLKTTAGPEQPLALELWDKNRIFRLDP